MSTKLSDCYKDLRNTIDELQACAKEASADSLGITEEELATFRERVTQLEECAAEVRKSLDAVRLKLFDIV